MSRSTQQHRVKATDVNEPLTIHLATPGGMDHFFAQTYNTLRFRTTKLLRTASRCPQPVMVRDGALSSLFTDGAACSDRFHRSVHGDP